MLAASKPASECLKSSSGSVRIRSKDQMDVFRIFEVDLIWQALSGILRIRRIQKTLLKNVWRKNTSRFLKKMALSKQNLLLARKYENRGPYSIDIMRSQRGLKGHFTCPIVGRGSINWQLKSVNYSLRNHRGQKAWENIFWKLFSLVDHCNILEFYW